MLKEKLLFVFNQNNPDENICQILKRCQSEFTCFHAQTTAEAKTLLQTTAFDIVISEMELPDSTGADLQKYIYDNHPGVIRIIYSEQADRDLIYKSAKYVHQFISYPVQTEQFVNILKNVIGLQKVLSNKSLHERIASITTLPSPPEVYNQLISELQKDDPSIRDIAELIKTDVSITAKLLHMVNSAFFGFSSHVENPLHAVNLLGVDTIQSLVMTAGLFNQFDDPRIPGFSLDSIYSNSLSVGTSARHLANAFGLITKQTDDALMAGMLHDTGKLVMLSYFPEELKQSAALAQEKSIPLFEAEKEILGVTDAEIGAHLLSLWGLPHSILEAIAMHYTPAKIEAPMTNVLTAVHLAYALNYDKQNNIRDEIKSAVDQKYMEKLELNTSIDSLKNFCLAATN